MNDVLNSQGYTQAAWLNHIPTAAWGLMAAIAICGNLLIGYGSRRAAKGILFFVITLVVSISFFLIADIDAPRRGIIRVRPQNLISLAESLHAHISRKVAIMTEKIERWVFAAWAGICPGTAEVFVN